MFNQYLSSAALSVIILLVLVAAATYVMRNKLKAIFASIFGYRVSVDDHSISVHRNLDTIIRNQRMILFKEITPVSFVWIASAGAAALLSPWAVLAVIASHRIYYTKKKMSDLIHFDLFKADKNDDIVMAFLNSKKAALDLLVNEGWYLSVLTMAIGVLFENWWIAGIGIMLAAVLLISAAILVANAIMYQVNYKQLQHYRALRILSTSALVSKKSLAMIGILSFVTNFTELAGFSPFVWLIFGLNLVIDITINTFFRRTNSVSSRHEKIESREYEDIVKAASYPNPRSQSRGYRFARPLDLKFFQIEKEAAGKDLIHIDNYAFFPQMINRSPLRLNPEVTEALTSGVNVKFQALDFTKQLLMLGGMGSGKTEMIHFIIEQVHQSGFTKFQSIVYNDIKGDYRERFYRPEKDIVVNLFDKDGAVWDVFEEMEHNIEVGSNFINNLFVSIAGDEKDFFSGKAKQLAGRWLQEAFFAGKNSQDRWEIFFSRIAEYEADTNKTQDKTKSSVLQTIEISTEILSIMRYQIVEEKRKTFSLKDFVYAQDIQMFLVNDKRYESKLTPYLNGVWGALNATMMAKQDTKEHLILNILDEFLSMSLDPTTRRSMMTATRSKGAANIIAGQYLPKDEKLIQEVDSSRYAMIVFAINDDFTLEAVSKKLANVEMLQATLSPYRSNTINGGNGGISGAVSALSAITKNMSEDDRVNYSLSTTQMAFSQQLQSMPKYTHLTFIPGEEFVRVDETDEEDFFKLMVYGYEKEMIDIANQNPFLDKESGIIYLGYTPQAGMNFNNPAAEHWDMSGYYAARYAEKKEIQKASKYTDKEVFHHWWNLTFEIADADEMVAYIEKHGLTDPEVEERIKAFDETPETISAFKNRYTKKEREQILDEIFNTEDLQKRFEIAALHHAETVLFGGFDDLGGDDE